VCRLTRALSLAPILIALLWTAVFEPLSAPATAQEAQGQSTAGLVIVTGSGAEGYALVRFDEPEISGIELLRRSGAEPVTVTFGGLGEAVCAIGETGCSVEVCRRRVCQGPRPDDPYWQLFALNAEGRWQSLPLGASADRVRDGEVRLWAWTAGTPALAPLTIGDISHETSDRAGTVVWSGESDGSSEAEVGQGAATSLLAGVGVLAAAVLAAGVLLLRSGRWVR
jgi:hypothetical protein